MRVQHVWSGVGWTWESYRIGPRCLGGHGQCLCVTPVPGSSTLEMTNDNNNCGGHQCITFLAVEYRSPW